MTEPKGSLFGMQMLIALQILISVPLQIGFFLYGMHHFTLNAPASEAMGDRLAYTIQWDFYGALVLLAMIGFIAGARPTRKDVIDGNDQAEALAVQVRIQRNTLEQLVLMMFAHLTLATLLPMEQMKAIPVLVMLFAIARFVYWIGYSINPLYRTVGFVGTFYPNIAALAYAVYLMS